MFKIRLGTHRLNEKLGRYRGRNGKTKCTLCGAECESVVHVLWECPVYKDNWDEFMAKLMNLLRETLKGFDSLGDVDKNIFVLGCELLEEDFACCSEDRHIQFVGH